MQPFADDDDDDDDDDSTYNDNSNIINLECAIFSVLTLQFTVHHHRTKLFLAFL